MGKIYCISYGTKEYEKELKLNIESAKEMGADVVKAFGPKDIDRQYYEKNIGFFSQKRGGGYWLWKPYIIDKMLSEIAYNDWLIYVDAGLFYINSIKNYIKTLEQREVSFAIVPTVYKEYQYTKRDIFVYTNTDTEEIRNTLQRQSGVIIIKKIEKNIELIREWLKYIQEGTMVNDEPNT